ncbi:SusD/RagB family nutrient-binding outer membrane lipoprotein [Aquimarina hainanensis]|uniref:SusD/RagB family nutrient-binding outer membrane lipoprotein n=1 Tax=Aquimarina hainanensis TaxID=1578017 RepID=A0ABW5N9Z6_9FLAO
MKNTKSILVASFVFIICFFSSCETTDFGDTNTNPNQPSNAVTSGLLTEAQKYLGNNYSTATVPNLYVQYLSNGDYPDESRYLGFNFSYDTEYQDVLVNLNEIIKVCTDETTKENASVYGGLNNQIAVSKILRSYIFVTIADRWGYAPYTEALKGTENLFPKYESVETIYKGSFEEIDEALSLINSEAGPVGDILFNGNMDNWKKLANSLKVIMSIRISKQVPGTTEYAALQYKKSIENAISGNNENIIYTFLEEDSNDNPWQDRFESRKDYCMAETFVNAMIGNGNPETPQDPRLDKYSDKPVNTPTKHAGGVYGEQNDTSDFSSITSNIIKNSKAPSFLFTYSQMLFAKAEAVELGWDAGSSEQLTKDAIKASMEQWEVNNTDITTYINTITYDGLKTIAYEKWVALFLQGHESWAEWRRYESLGVAPTLKIITNAINGNGIPRRHAYPGTAPSLNKENYDNAVKAQGKDDLDTNLWWAL